jgi:hypothetical protein
VCRVSTILPDETAAAASGVCDVENGESVDGSSREPSPSPALRSAIQSDQPAAAGDARNIFSMGFPVDQVRHAADSCIVAI